MFNQSRIHSHLPNILSGFRIVFTPFLFFLIFSELYSLGLIFFIINVLSDIIDGYIARKFDICTKMGGYLDIIGDLSIILSSLIAIIVKKIYPIWVLIIVLLMFFQFIATSKGKEPRHDPIGKYYGSFFLPLIRELQIIVYRI